MNKLAQLSRMPNPALKRAQDQRLREMHHVLQPTIRREMAPLREADETNQYLLFVILGLCVLMLLLAFMLLFNQSPPYPFHQCAQMRDGSTWCQMTLPQRSDPPGRPR